METADAFRSLVCELEQDSSQLRTLSALRPTSDGLPHADSLAELERTLCSLEEQARNLSTFVQTEADALLEIDALGKSAAAHADFIAGTSQNLPPHLPSAYVPPAEQRQRRRRRQEAPPVLQPVAQAQVQAGAQVSHQPYGLSTANPPQPGSVQRARPTIAYVTAEELASVPKATASRITLAVLNEAVEAIQKVVDAKARIIALAKDKGKLSTKERELLSLYRSQRTPDHGKAFFVQEKDVAAVVALGSGKGKSIVRTLR